MSEARSGALPGPTSALGELSKKPALAWWLRTAATVQIGLGHWELAARIAGAAIEAQKRSAGVVVGWQQRDFDHHIDAVRSELGDAAFGEAWEAGRKLTMDDACLEALRPVDVATPID